MTRNTILYLIVAALFFVVGSLNLFGSDLDGATDVVVVAANFVAAIFFLVAGIRARSSGNRATGRRDGDEP